MSGKQQYSDAVYDRIVELYKSGATMKNIQLEAGVARNTVYAALKARGEAKRRDAAVPEPAAEPATAAPEKPFVKAKKLPDIPCGCGRGCGLTFKRSVGQRTRKLAVDCPFADEYRKEQIARWSVASKEKRERLRAAQPPRNAAGRHDFTPRRGGKPCPVCYNLPHARAIPVCKGCGLPHVGTPSLKNHAELSAGAANKWQALDIETEEKIVAQYKANRTIRTIGKNCDVDHMSIYRVLRDYGVTLRTK